MTPSPENDASAASESTPAVADATPTQSLDVPGPTLMPPPAAPVPSAPAKASNTRTILEIVGGVVAVGAVLVAAVAGFALGYVVKGHDDRRGEVTGFAMGRMWDQQGDDGDSRDQGGRGLPGFGEGQQGMPFGGGPRQDGMNGRDEWSMPAQPFGGQGDSTLPTQPNGTAPGAPTTPVVPSPAG
jgi:hypothetical protein